MLCFFRASIHPVPSTSLSRCSSTDTTVPTLCTDGVSVHLVLKTSWPKHLCMLLRDRRIDRCFLLTKASVHLVLKGSSWFVSVLFKLGHQIDRRFGPMDRQFIRCLSSRLQLSNSSDATRMWAVVHPTVPIQMAFCAVYQVHRRSPLGCRRFIRQCHFLFSCVFDFGSTCHLLEPSYHCFITLKDRLSSEFGMWYFGFNRGYIHGTYKCLQGHARQYG
jgi:hypothetical protein